MARNFPFIDGWDCYTDYTKRWDAAWGMYAMGGWGQNITTIAQTGGRNDSGCMEQNYSSGGLRRNRGFSNKATWIVGVACKPTLYQGFQHLLCFLDGLTAQVNIRINADGSVSAHVDNDDEALGASAVGLVAANSWNYYEVKVIFHGSAGVVQVRLNGNPTPILDLSSQNTLNTANAYANGLVIGAYYYRLDGSGSTALFDDLYVDYDTDAEFRGDCRVFTLYPTDAGAYAEWTPTDSPNWECVNETDPNESDHVSEGTPGIRDTYTHDPMPISPDGATIHVVAVSPCAKKSEPGVAEIAPMIRSNGTDDVGDTVIPVAGSFLYYTSFWETDPGDSGNPWDVAAVDALEFGQKVIT